MVEGLRKAGIPEGEKKAELNRRDRKRAPARIHKSADILSRKTEQKRIRNAKKYT